MPIGFHCVTSAKYDQTATLLRQGYSTSIPNESGVPEGYYKIEKHPITGEPIRVWVGGRLDDDPSTPDIDESLNVFRFECQARPVITGGLNSQGTTERWNSKGGYENVEFVEIQIPKHVVVTKRDRITDITDSRNNQIWVEEEAGSFKPTVFDVLGVAPSLDPFGSVIEFFALLKRSDVQEGRENA